MAPWDAAGGGGGMLGGVARGCVFTSAGESGIAVAFSFLSAIVRGSRSPGPGGAGGKEHGMCRNKPPHPSLSLSACVPSPPCAAENWPQPRAPSPGVLEPQEGLLDAKEGALSINTAHPPLVLLRNQGSLWPLVV